LSACGGGGGGSAPAASVLSNDNNPLKKYDGTYYICDQNGHSKTTLTVVAAGSNSMTMSMSEATYQSVNCTGTIVGTLSFPLPLTATYQSQTTANFPHVTIMPRADTVDGVSVSSPAMTAQLTGTGVSGNCVNYTNGNLCYDNLVSPAQTAVGAAYLRGNYFVTFSLLNGVLAADGIYSKDPAFGYSMLVPN